MTDPDYEIQTRPAPLRGAADPKAKASAAGPCCNHKQPGGPASARSKGKLGTLGCILGALGVIFGDLGVILGGLGDSLGALWAILGAIGTI